MISICLGKEPVGDLYIYLHCDSIKIPLLGVPSEGNCPGIPICFVKARIEIVESEKGPQHQSLADFIYKQWNNPPEVTVK